MDNFIGIEQWEREREYKLRTEQSILTSLKYVLMNYSQYLDEDSLEIIQDYTENSFEVYLNIPMDEIQDYYQTFYIITDLLEGYYKYNKGPGSEYSTVYVDVMSKPLDKIFKIKITRYWGLDV